MHFDTKLVISGALLVSYYIESLSFEDNEERSDIETSSLEISAKDPVRDGDDGLYELSMEIRAFFAGKMPVGKCSVVIHGAFAAQHDLEDQDAVLVISTDGASELYAIARAHVLQATALRSDGPVVLPSIRIES